MSGVDVHLSCNLKCCLWYLVLFVVAFYLLRFIGVFRFLQLKFQQKFMQLVSPKTNKLPLVISAKTQLFKSMKDFKTPPCILEVGAGDCWNLEYFPKGSRYIVVEPNEHFHEPLRKRVEEVGTHLKFEALHQDYAEKLSHVQDESVDAYVLTHVTCSVDDMEATLSEANRVLKPGGRLYIFHHFLGPNAQQKSLRLLMEMWLLLPFASRLMHCDYDRDIEAEVRRHFPKTDATVVALPMALIVLQYHLLTVSVKT